MRSHFTWQTIILTVCVMLALPALATYSGLVLIPTADVIGDKQYSAELQANGTLENSSDNSYFVNTEFGFADRLEAGIDFDVTEDADPTMLLNAKVVAIPETARVPAVAVGVFNLADGIEATPYVVATRDWRVVRGHLGALHDNDVIYGFIGADAPVTEKLTLMADYTQGSKNAASAGLCYQFTDSVSLLAGAIFPNSGDQTSYTVHLIFGGPCFR